MNEKCPLHGSDHPAFLCPERKLAEFTVEEIALLRHCINIAYDSQIHGRISTYLTIEQKQILIGMRKKIAPII